MAKPGQSTTADRFDFEEYLRFLSCLRVNKEYRFELLFRVQFYTATRIGDALRLVWKDILDKEITYITEGKTKKTREVCFGEKARKTIRELYELLGCPELTAPLYPNRKGKSITEQYVNQQLKEFKVKYNLKIGNISTHTFRKTFGHRVYEKENQSTDALFKLQEIFRHTSPDITLRYIGFRRAERLEIFRTLDD